MNIDEELYRQYLCGDEAGLEALMKKYGDPLILYIKGQYSNLEYTPINGHFYSAYLFMLKIESLIKPWTDVNSILQY